MKEKTVNNENGSVLVIALIMLALLTTLGIMSTNTTSIDLQIAQNERISTQNFNMAEAAALQAAQRLVDEGITGKTNPRPAWITACPDETCTYPYREVDNWFAADGTAKAEIVTESDATDTMLTNMNPIDNVSLYYTVQYNGEISGASIGLGTSTILLDKFTCYGLYRDASRGEVLIEVALTKATS